jgi:hypothetical protein
VLATVITLIVAVKISLKRIVINLYHPTNVKSPYYHKAVRALLII